MELSDAERQRRRENMQRLHREGRAGGQFGKLGGRPRKPRASEIIAEKVQAQGNEYFERLHSIVMESADKNSIAAFKELVRIEEQERKIEVEEEEKIDMLRREELIELVSRQLRELEEAGTLPIITVGEIEVIADAGPSENGETARGIEAAE